MSYLSTCKAIQVLARRCQNICVPINNTCSYDLIVDAESVISRVKVIRTDCLVESGCYLVNLRKSAGAPFTKDMCDFVFVDSPDGCYLIPSSCITQKRAISLSVFKAYLIQEEKNLKTSISETTVP
jgi:hypothetical protein